MIDYPTPPNTGKITLRTRLLITTRAYTLSTEIYSIQTKTKTVTGENDLYGQGSERSENGLVWTGQSSHSQVWS